MIVLSMETSTARSSVAVLIDGVVTASEAHEDARGHGAFLAPAVRRCLDVVGGASAVGAVAVGTGPGLYTGLRVGMATAGAFASALDLPVIGIGGLDVLAHMADAAAPVVVTTLDARRGQVFWMVHHRGSGAVPDGPYVGDREQLATAVAAQVAAHGESAVTIVGEIGGPEVVRPDAGVLARLAADRISTVEPAQWRVEFSAAALTAVYLRDADVRIGWNERGGVRAGGPA